MRANFLDNTRRFLLLAMVLLWSLQVSAMSVPLAQDGETASAAITSCHDGMQAAAASQSGSEALADIPTVSSHDCCDENCSMPACHTVSPIVQATLAPQMPKTANVPAFVARIYLSSPFDSPYRPPNLA